MSAKYEEIKEDIKELVKDGKRFFNSILLMNNYYKSNVKEMANKDLKEIRFFLTNYEKWYTKALCLVKQILPEREADFISLYKNEKRKEINWQNYTLSDAVQQKANSTCAFHPGNALEKMMQQVAIVETCLEKFDNKIFDLQTVLHSDVFDSEIDSARHLCKKGFYRAAGAISGVVLEKHFASICHNRGIVLKKKAPTIADYNDALKDVAYDTIEWRKIQRLGDLRNLCDHNKDREPTMEEVDELISGVERIIKTMY